MLAIQHCAVPLPSGQPPVISALPDEAVSVTVTSAVEPPSTDTSTTKPALSPGRTLDAPDCTLTHRLATVRPCNCWHCAPDDSGLANAGAARAPLMSTVPATSTVIVTMRGGRISSPFP